jgi:predicted aspartyl protease
LIDSGATSSIFRPEVAEELGLKLEKGKGIYLTGVGGRIKGYLHQLKMEVAGKQFTCPIIFSYEYAVSFNLLGRQEFFKNFIIVFNEKKKTIELK